MRSGITGIVAVVLLIVAVVLASSSMFTVQQTEQALVLRFGEPVPGRGLITEPGLHFKVPFVETVVFLDNRILDLDNPNEEVLASDNQRIEVDSFARYKIVDALKFYQTVGTIARANNQLSSVLNSAVRRVLGEATLPQFVREEREALMAKIRDQVNAEGATLGVNVIDVRIRHADLPTEISEKIYDRMKTERQREAAGYRAQGAEQAREITSKAERDVTVLKAEAKQQGDKVRGQGDAERSRIYAQAFGRDPDFFAFYRSMLAYEASLSTAGSTRFVLSPTSEFFRYFNNPAAAAPSAVPDRLPTPAAAAAPSPAPAAAAPAAAPPASSPAPAPVPAPAAPTPPAAQ